MHLLGAIVVISTVQEKIILQERSITLAIVCLR